MPRTPDPYVTAKQKGWKYCSKCRIMHPLADFYPNKTTTDGFSYYCKESDRKARQASDNKHREEINKRNRERRQIAEQPELIPSKQTKKTCNCHQYKTCLRCRNAERRRAFRADEVPVYRMQPAVAGNGD